MGQHKKDAAIARRIRALVNDLRREPEVVNAVPESPGRIRVVVSGRDPITVHYKQVRRVGAATFVQLVVARDDVQCSVLDGWEVVTSDDDWSMCEF